MSKTFSRSFEFGGLCFYPETNRLEAAGEIVILPKNLSLFLLCLLEKPSEFVGYEELREKIWANTKEVDESVKHIIHVTKGNLVKTLKTLGFDTTLLKFSSGKGYSLDAEVVQIADAETEIQPEQISTDETNQPRWFAWLTSIFYGLLFSLASVLEIAYQFDRYGKTALWLGAVLIFLNGGAMFAALKQNFRKNRPAFWIGVGFLIGGAVLSCAAAMFFLPSEPITLAKFQTQPAMAAFLKNALIYFLPLGVFCVFTPFYLVRRNLGQTTKNLLPNLFGLLFLALIYSLVSTFYLLDNLIPADFHALFVTLVFLRFAVYFGLGAACLLWAKSQTNDDWSQLFSLRTISFFRAKQ